MAPSTLHVTTIHDATQPNAAPFLRAIESGAARFGVQVAGVAVRDAGEIERVIAAIAAKPSGGLIVFAGPLMTTRREQIIALAARHRLPAVYPFRFFAASGGLASYGVDNIDLYRLAASYIDRILKGERPANLPVQSGDQIRTGDQPEDRQGTRP